MFVRNTQKRPHGGIETSFPGTKFLLMFVGVVTGPFLMFAINGHSSGGRWQSDLIWAVPAIALLAIGVGAGLMVFRLHSRAPLPPSIQATFS